MVLVWDPLYETGMLSGQGGNLFYFKTGELAIWYFEDSDPIIECDPRKGLLN